MNYTETMFTYATGSLLVLASFACGPRVAPEGPGESPGTAAPTAVRTGPTAGPPVRETVVGELCPRGAGGRPAVLPLFLRAVNWSDDGEEVSTPIETHRARQFSVLAWDGRRAGIFSVAGASDLGLERKAAIGAYAGVSPCSLASRASAASRDDAACVAAQSHCGLALAALAPRGSEAPFEEDPEPAAFATAGACKAGDKLVVDIDGDGTAEAYPVAAFLDPVRAPAEEVLAVPLGNASCSPVFATRGVLPAEQPTEWRGQVLNHWLGLDVLGVVDIDGDSRHEIVVSYHYSDRRTWAVYSAVSTVGRLDLVGEAVPWPNR